MESHGCFTNALRTVWASIRNKIRKRGVKQRRKNLRISKMEAMDKQDQVWNRGLNKKVKSTVKVLKSGAKTSMDDQRRAQLVASGWNPRRGEGNTSRSKLQRKPDITLKVFHESFTQDLSDEVQVQVHFEAPVETSSGQEDNTKTILLGKNMEYIETEALKFHND